VNLFTGKGGFYYQFVPNRELNEKK